MSEPRKHHYIPRFYLSGWSGKDGRLTYYKGERGRVVVGRIGPKGTGFEKDLYTFAATPDDVGLLVETDLLTPRHPESLEEILQQYLHGLTTPAEFRQLFEKRFTFSIDDGASKVLRKIRAGNLAALTEEERLTWAQFVMSLPLRNPEAVADIKDEARSAALQRGGEHLRKEFQETREDNDMATLLQGVLSTDDVIQRLAADYGLWVIEGIVRNPDYQRRLTSLSWWTVDFAQAKHSLLTSDRPYLPLRPLSHPRSLFYVPVSPRLGFFASPDPQKSEQLSRVDLSSLARSLNDFIVRLAFRYVYSADDSHLRFIANRLGVRQRTE